MHELDTFLILWSETFHLLFTFLFDLIPFIFSFTSRMMSNFYVTGKLTENGQVDRLSLKHTLPAFLFFAGVAAPMLGTEEGRGIYWRVALGGSVLGALWMAIKS